MATQSVKSNAVCQLSFPSFFFRYCVAASWFRAWESWAIGRAREPPGLVCVSECTGYRFCRISGDSCYVSCLISALFGYLVPYGIRLFRSGKLSLSDIGYQIIRPEVLCIRINYNSLVGAFKKKFRVLCALRSAQIQIGSTHENIG